MQLKSRLFKPNFKTTVVSMLLCETYKQVPLQGKYFIVYVECFKESLSRFNNMKYLNINPKPFLLSTEQSFWFLLKFLLSQEWLTNYFDILHSAREYQGPFIFKWWS